MDATALVERVEGALRVNRVFGEPVTVGGVTVIPVSHVGGGAGGGAGREIRPDGDGDGAAGRPAGEGSGGGMGWTGHPCGVVVLQDGHVRWQPALDVNRLVTAVSAVLIAGLLTARAIVRARS